MANDWLTDVEDEKDAWVGTKPLGQIEEDRQKLSDTPKIEPVPELAVPPETIPYKEIKPLLETSAKVILDSTLNMHRANISLAKALTVVPALGKKGSEIKSKLELFKTDIMELFKKSEDLCRAIAQFKDSLPDESLD